MNPAMQTGDGAGAIADFRKVLEISPGLSESLQRLGATQHRAVPTFRARKISAGGPCDGLCGS
jgi:hypothetical protein